MPGDPADDYYMSRIVRRALVGAVLTLVAGAVAVAPAQAAPSHAPSAPTATQFYTVKPGDYLALIAKKLKVSLDDLLEVNGLTKKSVIHPGDQLIIPPGGQDSSNPSPSPKTTGQVYTVKRGDYFQRIAQQLGVSVDALLSVNKMTKQSVIHPGDQLQIPVGGVAPPPSSDAAARVAMVLEFASAQLGEPYRFLGAGPDFWDCSGLTMRAYAVIGVSLPHQSALQAKRGTDIDWKVTPIQAGDLVFLDTNGTISHVGIATGPTTWIQSPQPGDVVRSGNIPMRRVFEVRRFVND